MIYLLALADRRGRRAARDDRAGRGELGRLSRLAAASQDSWAWFMGHWLTPWIFSVLAIVELVTDQLPNTPSRKVPQQFGARLITGALCGGDDRRGAGMSIGGLIAGVIGAVIGTLGGYEATQAPGRGDRRPRPADRAASRTPSPCSARC